jgi:hypothetical protein
MDVALPQLIRASLSASMKDSFFFFFSSAKAMGKVGVQNRSPPLVVATRLQGAIKDEDRKPGNKVLAFKSRNMPGTFRARRPSIG